MSIKTSIFYFSLLLISPLVFADSTTDAIIGGGLGGAAGAAIGNEIGGRDGAILGGALGGAAGAAIAADHNKYEHNYHRPYARYEYRERPGYYRESDYYGYRPPARKRNKAYFCPPGQSKKGRC